MAGRKMEPDEFIFELLWLVEGGCSGYEIESSFGSEMNTIRRRVQRRAAAVKPIVPAWHWHLRLLALDRHLNVLDVAARNPLAA